MVTPVDTLADLPDGDAAYAIRIGLRHTPHYEFDDGREDYGFKEPPTTTLWYAESDITGHGPEDLFSQLAPTLSHDAQVKLSDAFPAGTVYKDKTWVVHSLERLPADEIEEKRP